MLDSVASSNLIPSSSARGAHERAQQLISESHPVLDPESQTYAAAMILLIGTSLGCNIDRIARVTGYHRNVVAKAVRRLYDNGMWVEHRPVRDWSESELGPAFWRDVAVAEGVLYRRTTDTGELEWGVPGRWWKNFDFIPPSKSSGPGVQYSRAVDVSELVTEPLYEADSLQAAEAAAGVEALSTEFLGQEPGWSIERESISHANAEALAASSGAVASSKSKEEPSGPNALFPDAVWLS